MIYRFLRSKENRASCLALAILLMLMLVADVQLRRRRNFKNSRTDCGWDVFITIKTSQPFHSTRVPCIVETWFQLLPKNIYFVTDAADPVLSNKTDDHVISTPCRGGSHGLRPLNCKVTAELHAYSETSHRWFCHFDDDNYVNVPALRKLLDGLEPRADHYLGKASMKHPKAEYDASQFWFGTGGAGYCLSRALFNKIMPYLVSGYPLRGTLPDDVTVGYLVHLVHAQFTEIDLFHSHLEKEIPEWSWKTARRQISFAHQYGTTEKTCPFRGLHCFLFPDSALCNPIKHGQTRQSK